MIPDFSGFIPEHLKKRAFDRLVDVVVEQARRFVSDDLATSVKQLRSDAAFNTAFEASMERAVKRFMEEYELEDEDLVAAIAQDETLFQNEEMQQALLEMIKKPNLYLEAEQERVRKTFDTVLAGRRNRERVDKAITYLLRCLAEELWYLPELQPIYSLQFQRITAESVREQVSVQKAQLQVLANLNIGVREALLQLTDAIGEQKLLTAGDVQPRSIRPTIYHNLPQPDYIEFVGRAEELERLEELLSPQNRAWTITIDGIGGIGKSALALEMAHQYLRDHERVEITAPSAPTEDDFTAVLTELRQILTTRYSEGELQDLCFDMNVPFEDLLGDGRADKARELLAYLVRRQQLRDLLDIGNQQRPDIDWPKLKSLPCDTTQEPKRPSEEQVQAIIWVSAKRTILTADGISSRRQVLRTLDDVYAAISTTLQRKEIMRVQGYEQDRLVRDALTQQRTLLIIDNLETVDDDSVLAFLRELPPPTKAIVTTRHRIDVAYPIRLVGMPWSDAQKLIAQECQKKAVQLSDTDAEKLYHRTGGVPLALVWSIAQMGFGYGINAVLARLGLPSGDIARFCFDEAMGLIRERSAGKLLLALSLFATGAMRAALGFVAGLGDDVISRDEGLVKLERLSLVNRDNGIFTLLPLTKEYAHAERLREPDKGESFVERWLEYFLQIVAEEGSSHARWYNFEVLAREGENILAAVDDAYSLGRTDVVLGLVPAVYWYLDIAGRWSDSLKYGAQAIELATVAGDHVALAGIARQSGWILGQQGDFDQAEVLFQQGLEACQSIAGDQRYVWEADLLMARAQATRKRGDFEAARQILDRCQALINERQLSDEVQTDIDYELGKMARDRQDWVVAQHHFREIIVWAEQKQQNGTPYAQDVVEGARGSLAMVLYHLGDYEEARHMCRESMRFFEQHGGQGYFGILNYRYAQIEAALGNREQALQAATAALEIGRQVGMKLELTEMEALVQQLEEQTN